jgi:hypothetical protein
MIEGRLESECEMKMKRRVQESHWLLQRFIDYVKVGPGRQKESSSSIIWHMLRVNCLEVLGFVSIYVRPMSPHKYPTGKWINTYIYDTEHHNFNILEI